MTQRLNILHVHPGALLICSGLLIVSDALSDQRLLAVVIANYPEAPVIVRHAQVKVVELYVSPAQLPLPDLEMPRSRVRYMNFKGKTPPSYQLEGDIRCLNHAAKRVEAIQVTYVFLNLFHESLEREDATLMGRIEPGATTTLSWSRVFRSREADEVRLAITAVRFSDGSVWRAPSKDLFAWPE